jgi:hypothetical protein
VENAFGDLLESQEALSLVSSAAADGLPVFAMCSASRVLAAAGVLRGKFMVGSPRFEEEYKRAGADYRGNPRNDVPPAIDGNIVTAARGQAYDKANCQALATLVENRGRRGPKKTAAPVLKAPRRLPAEVEGLKRACAIGGEGRQGARGICPAPGGGYIVAGYSAGPGSKDPDALLLKTDETGRVEWARVYGGAGTEYGNHILALEDGYLLTGFTTSFGKGSRDVYLVRVDAAGKEIWSRTFGGASWDVGTASCPAEGGFLVCGYTRSSGRGEEDILVIKVGDDGREIWSRTYGGPRLDMGAAIALSGDGGFFVGASSLSFSGNTDFHLVRAAADGSEMWSRTYPFEGKRGYGFEWLTGMTACRDGGVVLAGYGDGSDLMDVILAKVDAGGELGWRKSTGRAGFYDFGNAVLELADGSLLVAGVTKTFVADKLLADNDVSLVKISAGGDILRETTLVLPGRQWITAIAPASDGEVVLAGHAGPGENGRFDVLLALFRAGD